MSFSILSTVGWSERCGKRQMGDVMKASMAQAKHILDLFDGQSAWGVQNFIEAGDLVKMMLSVDLGCVDRRVFAQALGLDVQVVDLARYHHLLLSPFDQKQRLMEYNLKYWGGRFTNEILALDTSGDTNITQRVDDLTIFHVQFDSLEETAEMWWRVYVGEQPAHWRSDALQLDCEHLRLLASNIAIYEPGIHRVRINLVAHWEPESGRTIEEVRDQAKGTNEILAQLEVLSAYGLHPELFREQDGENLPYTDMPGTSVSVPYTPSPCALCIYWNRTYCKADLDAYWVGNRFYKWAAPVVRES